MKSKVSNTCVALATAVGEAGLAVIRISGEDSFTIADKIFRKGPIPVLKTSEDKGSLLHFEKEKNQLESEETVVSNMKAYQACLGYIKDPFSNKIIDQAICLKFIGPRSYTGENVVEFSIHGSSFLASEILRLCLQNGAVMAQAGEFTKRAFINGKIDLTQVEAVADLIHSQSSLATGAALNNLAGSLKLYLQKLRAPLLELRAILELSIQYPEHEESYIDFTQIKKTLEKSLTDVNNLCESFRSMQTVKQTWKLAILGKPNAGKSSLLNTLTGKDSAIVTNVPGTTRDCIEAGIFLNGYQLSLIDTAGLRETDDEVEKIGVDKARKISTEANAILWLSSLELAPEQAAEDFIKEMSFFIKNQLDSVNDSLNADNLKQLIKNFLDKLILIFTKNDIVEFLIRDYVFYFMKALPSLFKNFFTLSCSSEYFDTYFWQDNINYLDLNSVNLDGYNDLKKAISQLLPQLNMDLNTQILINSEFQYNLLRDLESQIENCLENIDHLPLDILSLTVESFMEQIAVLTGENINEELFKEIFSKFCVGK